MTKRGDDGNETLGNRQGDEQRIERATERQSRHDENVGGNGKRRDEDGRERKDGGEVVMIMAAVVVMPHDATAPGPRVD